MSCCAFFSLLLLECFRLTVLPFDIMPWLRLLGTALFLLRCLPGYCRIWGWKHSSKMSVFYDAGEFFRFRLLDVLIPCLLNRLTPRLQTFGFVVMLLCHYVRLSFCSPFLSYGGVDNVLFGNESCEFFMFKTGSCLTPLQSLAWLFFLAKNPEKPLCGSC